MGLSVEQDFGENITLTGGLCFQTEASWKHFISKDTVTFGGCDFEIYFEEEEFDSFLLRLEKNPELNFVHPPLEHRRGQRVVRIYDPDLHILEMAERMDISLEMVTAELHADSTIEKKS